MKTGERGASLTGGYFTLQPQSSISSLLHTTEYSKVPASYWVAVKEPIKLTILGNDNIYCIYPCDNLT